MIKVKNGIATRDPIPDFLIGLAPETLLDLTWTDPAQGVSDCAWWPERAQSTNYDPLAYYLGAEVLTPVPSQKIVVVSHQIVALAPDVIAARQAASAVTEWEAIKVERDRREFLGFPLAGHWFHSDIASQVKYLGLKDKARDLMAAGGSMNDYVTEAGQVIPWHTLDNADVPMTAQLAFDLVAAVARLQATLFAISKAHKTAMEKTRDPLTYDFSTGWPQSYLG